MPLSSIAALRVCESVEPHCSRRPPPTCAGCGATPAHQLRASRHPPGAPRRPPTP